MAGAGRLRRLPAAESSSTSASAAPASSGAAAVSACGEDTAAAALVRRDADRGLHLAPRLEIAGRHGEDPLDVHLEEDLEPHVTRAPRAIPSSNSFPSS